MAIELDLRQLALDRGGPAASRRGSDSVRGSGSSPGPGSAPGPGDARRLISRYVVPGLVILGFLALLGWAARDRFLPSRAVTVVPVVVTRAEVQQAGTPLFQTAGWIEPRPTPVSVAALADGIIADLLVVEGQDVEAGQPVARLIDADAKLLLDQAQADLALREAELENAQAELHAARLRLENPVHLQAALSEAQSQLARTETELAAAPFLIQAAEARSVYAEQNLTGKQASGAALAGRVIQQAQSEHESAVAELRQLQERQSRLSSEADALRQRRDAMAQQLELLIDETRQLTAAAAQAKAAEARKRQAELAVQAAQLRLDRMTVQAPTAGRVLSLVAWPGSRVTGLDSAGEQAANNTVVTLYNPQMLQVRADVRLEDVPLLQPGQSVLLQTASVKEPMPGHVLYVTSQASIQKNTLEVKVAIASPPPNVRPEMLVTATFLAPEPTGSGGEAAEDQERLLVPRQLIEPSGEEATLWLAAPDGTARRKSVRLGQAGTDELVEVLQGLRPTDRLIAGGREGLSDGDSITISGEDNSIGKLAPSALR